MNNRSYAPVESVDPGEDVNQTEREAFEAIVRRDGGCTRRANWNGADYVEATVEYAWRHFQAGAASQREQVKGMVEALDELVKINEDHNKAVQEIIGGGVTLDWKDSYLDKAREALATYRSAQEGK